MNGLLHSRKFWLAVFGVAQALVFHFLEIPDDIWQSIAALVGVLIASIAIEDAAEKRAGLTYILDDLIANDNPEQ